MTDAVIVSTARTGIGKAYRGAFNNTHGATMAAHVVRAAVERARALGTFEARMTGMTGANAGAVAPKMDAAAK